MGIRDKKRKKRVRKGVAAIIFMKVNGKKRYLIFKRKQNWKGWECLKGGCKKGEDKLKCLRREMKEETGLECYKFKKTPFIHLFDYQRPFFKDKKRYFGANNVLYIVEIFSDKIKLNRKEHSGYRFVDKKTALKMLTWEDFKKLFKKVA